MTMGSTMPDGKKQGMGDSSGISGSSPEERQVDGLQQALEPMRAFSGEIDRLTESARTATSFVRSLHEQLRVPIGVSSGNSGSSAGSGGVHTLSFVDQISTAITTSLVPSLDALDEGIAAALSARPRATSVSAASVFGTMRM